jgi:hypothetical protein
MSEDKKLKEEFCVFFDVLGTKNKFLTSNFEEEEKLVKGYENFIKDIKKILEENGFEKDKIKLFSDNIFINFPNTTLKEMYDVFRCLAYIQIKAIEKYNFLLRGGVEYSTIYNEKDIVIGKGLVEAVKLEEEANYPIIILGEKAQKEFLRILKEEKEEVLKKYKNFIHTIIRIDDKMYINYLLLYYEKNQEKSLNILLKHREFIRERLIENSKEFYKNTDYIEKDILGIHFFYKIFEYRKYDILENMNQSNELSDIKNYQKLEEKKLKLEEGLKNMKEKFSKFESKFKDNEKGILKIREKYLYLFNYHNKMVDFLMKNNEDEKIKYSIELEEII